MCYMHELVCNLQNVNKSVYCFSKSSRTETGQQVESTLQLLFAVKNNKNMIGAKILLQFINK